jgi:hypothetical protein
MARSRLCFALLLLAATGCAEPAGDHIDPAEIEARLAELEARFTPGLHTLMGEVGARHAMLWSAGNAGNWPLADYVLHELGEVIEDIETLHPVYDGIAVAALLGEMTTPALDRLDAAVDAGDHEGFVVAYDQLTQACNACHIASDRAALRIVRPSGPPMTNLQFQP